MNARTAGAGAFQRSISTSAVSALVPCASCEVPMSSVSTLGLPWRSGSPSAAAGSNQAPVAMTTTPGHHIAIDDRAGETGAAIVEYAHDVAVADVAAGRVGRADADRLASGDFLPARYRPGIHLAVQAARGLVGHEMHGPALRRGAAEPLRRRDPGGMRRTVGMLKARNGVGDDLDASGRSFQRMALGIAAEIIEQDIVALGRRQLDKPFRPELLESGQRHPLGRGAGAHLIIDPLAPGHLVAAFGVRVLIAEALRQSAENVEIIAGLADRSDGAMHGENEASRAMSRRRRCAPATWSQAARYRHAARSASTSCHAR